MDSSSPQQAPRQQVLVLGGGSLVGNYLMPLLEQRGYRGYVVSRKKIETTANFTWLPSHEVQDASWHLQDRAIIISLWPLWLLVPIMTQFLGAAQLIALSSTSLFGKTKEMDRQEREITKRIVSAEEHVRVNSETFRIPYTILRPTLIYDCVHDHSINFISQIIRRFGFFMVAGNAAGLRQPVHAEDVAQAIVNSIANEPAYNKLLYVTGGETITYFTMIRRVAEALKSPIRIITVPKFIPKLLLLIMRYLGFTELSPSLFDRMNQDLAFDGSETNKILNIAPRNFEPKF